MDRFPWLRKATTAGLKITIYDGQLRIRGKRSAQPLVDELLSHRIEVKREGRRGPDRAVGRAGRHP